MNKPQDHKPKQGSGGALGEALGLQASNVAMKATLDNVVTKMLVIMRGLKDASVYTQNLDGSHTLEGAGEYLDVQVAQKFLNLVEETTSLTRAQTASLRSQPAFEYPDKEIQEILDRAVAEIKVVLLEPDREEKRSGE